MAYGYLGAAPVGHPARGTTGLLALNPTFAPTGDTPVAYTPVLYGPDLPPEGVPLTGGQPYSGGDLPTTIEEAVARGFIPPPPSAARWTGSVGLVAALAAGFFLLTRKL